MPWWGWILIAIGVLVVLAVALSRAVASRRTSGLRRRFGPEYERTVAESDDRRAAESELAEREERRASLEIRPLSPEAKERYVSDWHAVQAEFVDDPASAVARADVLIQSAMRERGYPIENFEQRAADVSVDHPQVVENYREGHRLAQARDGSGSTESLRQAMRHYRALFGELVEPSSDERDADEPLARETEAGRRDVVR